MDLQSFGGAKARIWKRCALVMAAVCSCTLLTAMLAHADDHGAAAAPAPAANTTGIRIAVIVPSKVFREMQARKDAQARIAQFASQLEDEHRKRDQAVQSMRAELAGGLKPGTQEYRDKEKTLMKMMIDNDAWQRLEQAELELQTKEGYQDLYRQIEKATGEVAQQKHLDLVLADVRPNLPDDLNAISMEEVSRALASRTMLYHSDAIDITQDVLARLDADYHNAGNGGGESKSPASK